MSTDLTTTGTREPDAEQKQNRVFQHPDYPTIEALILRGKHPSWIARWMEERYPLEDKDKVPLPNAVENGKLRIGERALARYRDKYFPEVIPCVQGLVNEDLERLIGHRLPAPVGRPWELDVLETVGIQAAQVNLQRAMAADEEMEMLNPVTMDAHGRLVDVLARSIDLKSRLGLAGYEAAPDKQHIFTQNEHLSVEVQGRIDPRSGQAIPVEPEKLDLARQLMNCSPDERAEIMEAARAAFTAPVIDGTAEEVPNADDAGAGSAA